MTKSRAGTIAVSRRRLLAGMGFTAAALSGGATALPQSAIRGWTFSTDVLVIGSGAAGSSAAIAARHGGATVTLVESQAEPGGVSLRSPGTVYAGGGTALQKALKIDDSPEDMYDFISRAGGRQFAPEKLQLYCENSAGHFDWLVEQKVPYGVKLSTARGLPAHGESLFYSGDEQSWAAHSFARAVPRGHVPRGIDTVGGRRLLDALLARNGELGVSLHAGVSAQNLITADDGSVLGALVTIAGKRKTIRARGGVVLACGGFIDNEVMLQGMAPELVEGALPWGGQASDGMGIKLGISVGGAVQRLHDGIVYSPLGPPDRVFSGILVNRQAQRFVAEDSFGGVIGHQIAYRQLGRAWLITDHDSNYRDGETRLAVVAEGSSIGEVADKLSFPRGALQHTVAYYNRQAARGKDPQFMKGTESVRPLQGPPYRAWDMGVSNGHAGTHTLGGLQTTVDGEVVSAFGDVIPGLYAAGRTTAGIAVAPFVAGGLSLADCTYFGRRAGAAAARRAI